MNNAYEVPTAGVISRTLPEAMEDQQPEEEVTGEVVEEPEEEVTGEVVEKTPRDAKMDAARVLLDKLRADAHPSITQMDMLEGMLPRELFPEYLAILTEKVQNDPYPSTALLERLERLSKS